MTTDAVASAVSSAIEVLHAVPSALVTDIDGTISRIVAHPEDATVSPRVREALRRLASKLDLVAVLTAREADVAKRMVEVEGLSYIGNYALDGELPDLDESFIDGAKLAAQTILAELPCVSFEDKSVAFALHYRNCEDVEAVHHRLLELVRPIAEAAGGVVLEGKQVIEVVPRTLPDKGHAVARLAAERGIRGLVYLGDDLGDVAAFRELKRRRVEDGQPGLAIAVVDGETKAAVRESADLTLAGVDAVEAFLDSLATELGNGGQA